MSIKVPLPTASTARPFLKWAGGKKQLLPELLARYRTVQNTGRYHEPFVGGGALFFHLNAQGLLGKKQAYLSDTNPNLVETYLAVRDDVEALIKLLAIHKQKHDHDYFYKTRAEVPSDATARAARVIYLNKTCFNGLYRENSRGEFNVPLGSYKNPLICDPPNLRAAAQALALAQITQRPFQNILKQAQPGDFVYFDPPYWPLSQTSNFTAYAKDNFGEQDQKALAQTFAQLTKRGVNALLSNSDAPFIHDLYAGFTIDCVLANRNVNSKPERRGKLTEVLIRNF